MRLLALILCLVVYQVSAFPSAAPPPIQHSEFTNYQQKWGLLIQFLDAFMYPNNTVEAAKVNSTLFSENVQGRVDLTSTFDGRELNTEYIFGLFSTIATNSAPGLFNILGIPVNYTVTGFTVTGNQVVASFIFNDFHSVGNISLPVETILFLQFDDKGEITEYDATIRRADWFFDTLFALLAPFVAKEANLAAPPTQDQLTQILISLIGQSVCQIHQKYCTGQNQQYPSFQACLNFMSSLPLGKPYELGQNTSSCRDIHQNMVPLRPSVHCPHIGPSGGAKCIPRDYVDVTTQQYFVNSFANPLAVQ